jgi:hypothetical protein
LQQHMESHIKRSVASCAVSCGCVDSKNPSYSVTGPSAEAQEHPDSKRACRCVSDASVRRPFLPLPCIVSTSAAPGKGRWWSSIRSWSQRHNINLAEAGGTGRGSTWTKDGERQHASKEGGGSSGKHLAKSWKAARSVNEASLAIFFLQEKRVLKDAYVSEAVVCS